MASILQLSLRAATVAKEIAVEGRRARAVPGAALYKRLAAYSSTQMVKMTWSLWTDMEGDHHSVRHDAPGVGEQQLRRVRHEPGADGLAEDLDDTLDIALRRGLRTMQFSPT